MLESLKTFEGIGELIIVDNDSTYEPLLQWYETKPCTIIKTKNCGHLSPWINKIPEQLGCKYYIVSDPDLDLSETPKDCILYLLNKLQNNKSFDKIGLSLKNWNVSEDSPYHKFLQNWAIKNWDTNRVFDGLLIDQQIDTTFAIYDIDKNPRGISCSTYLPYSVRHIPWEFTVQQIKNMESENYEFFYYLKNSTSSSSYKTMISHITNF